MLEFAKPLLNTLPQPPPIEVLRSMMTIVTVLWNLPLYERDGHPQAASFRATLDEAIRLMPADVRRIVSDLLYARLTKYAQDPRMGFIEVQEGARGEAQVVATAALKGSVGSGGKPWKKR